MKSFAVAFALAFVCGGAASAAERGTWLRDHFTGEWLVGDGGWRTSIGVDTHAPGFDQLGGGSELDLGLEVGSGFALLASGRVIAATGGYLEGLGGVAVQLHVSDRVRLRAGPAAGQLKVNGETGLLVGGFLAGSVDLFPFGGGRVATTISLRFDVDALPSSSKSLPDSTLALALGVGLRY